MDRQELRGDLGIVDAAVLAMKSGDDIQRFFWTVLQQQPSRRFGGEKQSNGDNDGEDELEGKRETPLESVAFEEEGVVHPV